MTHPATRRGWAERAASSLRSFASHYLVRASLGVLLLSVTANALAFLFHFSMARLLGPKDFGSLAALLALMTIVERPLVAVQVNVAHHVALWRQRQPARLQALLGALAQSSLYVGMALAVALVAFSTSLAQRPGARWELVALIGVGVALSSPASLLLGILQGQHRFLAYAWSGLAGAALRLLVGVGLVFAGWGLAGAVLGSIGRSLVGLASGLLLASWPQARSAKWNDTPAFLTYTFPVGIGLFAFGAMTTMDVLAAKAFLGPGDAGIYAGAALVAKVALLVSAGIGFVVLPMASEQGKAEARRLGILWRGLALTVLLTLLLGVPYATAPGLIVNAALGEGFGAAAPLLPIFIPSMVFLGIVGLVIRYFLALRLRRMTIALSGFAFLEAILLVFFHGSGVQIIIVLTASSAAAAVAGILMVLHVHAKPD